jgi:uncharacterized repeat protein (TIGR03803 family)
MHVLGNFNLRFSITSVVALLWSFVLVGTISAENVPTVLHQFFLNYHDGNTVYAGLTPDGLGNLYGTTAQGGLYQLGTVYELSPSAEGGFLPARASLTTCFISAKVKPTLLAFRMNSMYWIAS